MINNEMMLDEWVESILSKSPDKVIIEQGDIDIPCREFLEYANKLSHWLRQEGVEREDKVIVLLPRCYQVYIAMLGVLKSGAAYIPLDPEIPAERVNFIIADSGAKIIITADAILERTGSFLPQVCVFTIEHDWNYLDNFPSQALFVPNRTTSDLCYIIYTSGTSGNPKGVLLEHRNVINYLKAAQQIYPIAPDDRVLQGFSVSFDASVEEIWLPLSVGATLVVGTYDIMRSGDRFSSIVAALRITFLSCAPTLLSMVKEEIPGLRILIFGGEVCPTHLAKRWCKNGRTVYNTYGPTEATVIATYSVLDGESEVTIGKPLPQYDVFLVDENLCPVGVGEEGEILIGGESVARGYLNREDLTSTKFVHTDRINGQLTRFYRSGDIGRYNTDGDIVFVGRSDAQIKVRGFRVELAEIEVLLLASSGIQAAAVALDVESQQLAAYVVMEGNEELDRNEVAKLLRDKLPYYMIPSTLDIIDSLPVTTSQKVDRKRLPKPSAPLTKPSSHRTIVSPKTELEKKLVHALATHFDREDISLSDHFFNDLGGHSLLAAVIVSELREQKLFSNLSVMDIYQHPVLTDLVDCLTKKSIKENHYQQRKIHIPSNLSFYLCSLAQGVSMIFIALLFGIEWLGPFFVYSYYYQADSGVLYSLAMMLAMYFALLPALSLLVIGLKWLVIGRIRAGDYKLWGWYYFRFWLADKFIMICPVVYFTGTPIMNVFLKLLGAHIGKNSYINTNAISAYDLLTVGDNVSICTDSHLKGFIISDGYLHIGRIDIEDQCFVGTRCHLSHNIRMCRNSSTEDLTLIPEGTIVPENENWQGSEGEKIGVNGKQETRKLWTLSGTLLYGIGVFLIPLITMIAYVPGMMLITHIDYKYENYYFLLLTLVVAFSFVVILTLLIALFKWTLLGRIKEGRYPINSTFYYRKWFFDQLMKLSLQVIGTLYTTLYLQHWFKLLGVKMGKRMEVSTVEFISPDLLVTGDECFLADSVSVGASHVRNGYITIAKTYIGDRTFVGNSAVLSPGSRLGSDVLVGVLSKMDKQDLPAPDGTSWFGSPALFLPKRDINTEFSVDRTYKPSRKLFALRYFVEFFRVVLPSTFFIVLASLITNISSNLQADKSLIELFFIFPFLYLGTGILGCFIMALFKWIIIGRYRPCNKPLWSGFVWRSELVTGLYENFLVLFFLNMLTGSVFIKYPLRLLGCKIGNKCCLYSTQITEFDLLHVGDRSVLNDNCTMQTHLFEDRVMKMSNVVIGENCNVGGMAVVLYDSHMENGSSLEPLSILMKGESLPAETTFVGAPSKRV